jgi:hypothetical protein
MDLKIETIGEGIIAERFQDEIAKVVENIIDPNTEAKIIREINIKLKIKPIPENRELGELEVIVTSKLAPAKAHVGQVAVGVDVITGECNARELFQQSLFEEQPPVHGEKVTPISAQQ